MYDKACNNSAELNVILFEKYLSNKNVLDWYEKLEEKLSEKI